VDYLASWNNVFTFRDMTQRLLLRNGLQSSESDVARLKIAVDKAYRVLPTVHDWKFYKRRLTLTVEGSSTIDAVSYDHTGGAYERQLTITGSSTWPSSAAFGEVILGDVVYQIERRISNTVVTLTDETNPGQDVTTTGVVWFRSTYPFPVPVKQVAEVWRGSQILRLKACPPVDYPRVRKMFRQPGTPMQYAVLPSRDRVGMMELSLVPPPATQEVYEFHVEVAPTPLRTYEVSGSDAVTTAGSNTVTCAGASFSQNLVGTIFRLSPNSTLPSGIHYDEAGRTEFESQAVVRRVPSATTLELSEVMPTTTSGRGYSLSDFLDINPMTMLDYFESLAFEYFTTNVDHSKLVEAKELTRQAFRMALQAESTTNFDHEPAMFGAYTLGDKWWRYTTVLPPVF